MQAASLMEVKDDSRKNGLLESQTNDPVPRPTIH